MSAFTTEQIMFTLAWIAYAGDLQAAGPTSNARALRGEVLAWLAATDPVKGQWDLVWGPASCRFDGAVFDDGMVYVVRERRAPHEPPHFTIAIRGTNPISLSTWLLTNFTVATTASWPYGAPPAPLQPMISTGTHLALSRLESLVPVQGMPGEGLRLVDFLREEVANHRGAVVTLTGHSLGGLLASTLALALLDQRLAWDDAQQVSIEVYSFAAPIAGNSDFADYTNRRLGRALHRIWNTHDVVPRAWDPTLLEDLGAYYPKAPWWWLGFEFFRQATGLALAGRSYVHPAGAGTPRPGKAMRVLVPDFFVETIYQHGQAYIEQLELDHWLNQLDVIWLCKHAEQRIEEHAREVEAARSSRRNP